MKRSLEMILLVRHHIYHRRRKTRLERPTSAFRLFAMPLVSFFCYANQIQRYYKKTFVSLEISFSMAVCSCCQRCHALFSDSIDPLAVALSAYAQSSRIWASAMARCMAETQRMLAKSSFCDWDEVAMWIEMPSKQELLVYRSTLECGLSTKEIKCDIVLTPRWDQVGGDIDAFTVASETNAIDPSADGHRLSARRLWIPPSLQDQILPEMTDMIMDVSELEPNPIYCLCCALDARWCMNSVYLIDNSKLSMEETVSAVDRYWPCRFWRNDICCPDGHVTLSYNEACTWPLSVSDAVRPFVKLVSDCEGTSNAVAQTLRNMSATYILASDRRQIIKGDDDLQMHPASSRICNRPAFALLSVMDPRMTKPISALEVCIEAQHVPQWCASQESNVMRSITVGLRLFMSALVQSSETAEFDNNWICDAEKACRGLTLSMLGGNIIWAVITSPNTGAPCFDLLTGKMLHDVVEISAVRRAANRSLARNAVIRDVSNPPFVVFALSPQFSLRRRLLGCFTCESSYCCHASPDISMIGGRPVALLTSEDICTLWPNIVSDAAIADATSIALSAYGGQRKHYRLGRVCDCHACILTVPPASGQIDAALSNPHSIPPCPTVRQRRSLCRDTVAAKLSIHIRDACAGSADVRWPSISLVPYTPMLFDNGTMYTLMETMTTLKHLVAADPSAMRGNLVGDVQVPLTAGALELLAASSWDPLVLGPWLPACLRNMCGYTGLDKPAPRGHLYHEQRLIYCQFYKQMLGIDYQGLLHAMYELLRNMAAPAQSTHERHSQVMLSFDNFVNSRRIGGTYAAEIEDVAKRLPLRRCNAVVSCNTCPYAETVAPEECKEPKTDKPGKTIKMDPRLNACKARCLVDLKTRHMSVGQFVKISPIMYFAEAFASERKVMH